MPDPTTTTPVTDPVPVDPTNDKMYGLITAAVDAIANAIILFVHVTDAQRAALLIAANAVAALVAWVFISSNHAHVQARAMVRAAFLSRPVTPLPPPPFGR